MNKIQSSVDFEDAEDVRRGGGIAQRVESECRACDSLQLRALVQSEQAGHLARLQEVERVGPGGGGRPVALDALQLLRPLAAGHHVQLHILRLLLVEQHLRRQSRLPSAQHVSPQPLQRKLTDPTSGFLRPRYRLVRFSPDFCQPDKTEITRNLISTSPKIHDKYQYIMFVQK